MTPAKQLRRALGLADGKVANHPYQAENVPKYEKQDNAEIRQGEWVLPENFNDCVKALRKDGAVH